MSAKVSAKVQKRCQKCSDAGVVEKDGKLYECVCAFLRRIAASMPAFVRSAEVRRAHAELPAIGMVKRNLYITAHWDDMRAVIKVLIMKHPSKFIKMTSDAEIRDVYVGSKSRSARTEDFSGEIYNNIQDLVSGPELLLVRLNEISNKNKAAPGALEEALSHRMDYAKPTWVLSSAEKRFGPTSYAYSDAVWELLSTGYEHVVIPRIIPAPSASASPSFFSANLIDGQQADEEVHPERRKRPRARPAADEDDGPRHGLSIYGSGLSKPKKFGGKS